MSNGINMGINQTRVILNTRIPKNVQQIGTPEKDAKIYIEQYVKEYIEEISASNYDTIKIAVLVGESMCDVVYVTGAVSVGEDKLETEYRLSAEAWQEVYDVIGRHFPATEALGWVIMGGVDYDADKDLIDKAHVSNFGAGRKLLYITNWMDKNERMCLYNGKKLVELTGFYAYYSQNPGMQEYMVEEQARNKSKTQSINQDAENSTITKFESSIRPETGSNESKFENREKKTDSGKALDRGEVTDRRDMKDSHTDMAYTALKRLAYTAAVFVILAVCSVASVLLREDRNNDVLEIGADQNISSTIIAEGNATLTGEADDINGVGQPGAGSADDSQSGMGIDTKNTSGESNSDEDRNETSSAGENSIEISGLDKSDINSSEDNEGTSLTNAGNRQDAEDGSGASTDAAPVNEGTADDINGEAADSAEIAEEGGQEAATVSIPLKAHKVEAGDTLAAVSRRYYGDVYHIDEIKRLNGIADENVLEIGQILILP